MKFPPTYRTYDTAAPEKHCDDGTTTTPILFTIGFFHIYETVLKNLSPPFTKWYGTPTTKSLFLTKVFTYKSEAYYVGIQYWTQTTTDTKHLSVVISAIIFSSLPSAVSSVFLNDDMFVSNGIAMLSSFLTHLNPSSSENFLLAISDLTCLEMGVGKAASISYSVSAVYPNV